MNMRFSTLLATALVAGSISAFAQQTKAEVGDMLDGVKTGDYVTLNTTASPAFLCDTKTAYDFSTLTSLEDDAEKSFSAMWKITVIPGVGAAGTPTYSFENKLTGKMFAVKLQTNNKGASTAAATFDEEGNTEWAFNSKLGLYSVKGDSTFFFDNAYKLNAVKGGLDVALGSSAIPGNNAITPTALADKLELTLTPKIFNQITTSGKLIFANGKDVQDASVENFLKTKKWTAAAAEAKTAAEATTFMLATSDSTTSKNPYVLVVDTNYYTTASTNKLSHLIVDTLGAKPTHAALDGKYTAPTPEASYRLEKDKDGKVVKAIAVRPHASAMFTGKYYLKEDSIVLYAVNTAKATEVAEVVAKAEPYTYDGKDYLTVAAVKTAVGTALDGILSGVKTTVDGVIDAKTAPGAEYALTICEEEFKITYAASNYSYAVVSGATGVTGVTSDTWDNAKAALKADVDAYLTAAAGATKTAKKAVEDKIDALDGTTNGLDLTIYDATKVEIAYTAPVADKDAHPAYNKIDASVAYTGGHIALTVLDKNKIVITPAPVAIESEAAATAANFILPLIQPDFQIEEPEVDNTLTTIKDNLYRIKNADGKYLAVAINYADSVANWTRYDADFQALDHMPAYQWVVLQENATKTNSTIVMTNREYPEQSYEGVQLHKDDKGKIYYEVDKRKVYVTFEEVSAVAKSDTLLGYKNFDKDSLRVLTYTFNHFSPYDASHFIGVKSENDSVLTVKDYESAFKLQQVTDKAVRYGYEVKSDVAKRIPGLKNLYRNAYQVAVRDASANNGLNVFKNADNKFAVDEAGTNVRFYFKENNCDNGMHYYALVALSNDTTKAGVAENTKNAVLQAENMANINTSVFDIKPYDTPLYRRFNTALEKAVAGSEDAAKLLNFKETYRGEYLMDENNPKFQQTGIDFLGIWSEGKATGLSLHVDTAWVNRGLGYIKPQYLISVDRHEVAKVDTIPCNATGGHKHMTPDGKETTDANKCIHATPGKPGYVVAKYLVSFADSANVTDKATKEKPYMFGDYNRVGFVKAMYYKDMLIILTNGYEKADVDKLNPEAVIKAYKDAKIDGTWIKDLSKINDAHQTYTWSFRYVYPEKAASADKEDETVSFLIESQSGDGEVIAPKKGAWLKSQNGCLVLSDKKTSTFANAKTGGDNGLVFNLEVGSEENMATDNDAISTSEVSVIAGNGQVTINGAAGKKVVISNMLGQMKANTVIASDNETIAVPAGVVIVAVEGEEAVKAMVE
ncbi:DUF6383 domain-containing protein [Parabacteroides sp. AM08-6]|uniref:DUF6383 domain-containing protein n=1 Tax=Parabacteroides sp. AM08-6 TaxID=2292053 RepID=UPI000EFF5712|nr:DUF6383 domain-containing protein [Parabacteroides sp. AM08-6]RHJ76801.1 hypothetical protein DW103_16735 [Parabacteroides sp. AM08-6]